MSPQSLLYTPVELLQRAPAEGAEAASAERRERWLVRVVIGCLAAMVLGVAAVAWFASTHRPACAEAAPSPAAKACSLQV